MSTLNTTTSPTTVMKVKIYAPFNIYYDGPANSLSGVNDTGPFDILAGHKNFMSLLNPGLMTVRLNQRRDFVIRIGGGLMHVKSDRITVFLTG